VPAMTVICPGIARIGLGWTLQMAGRPCFGLGGGDRFGETDHRRRPVRSLAVEMPSSWPCSLSQGPNGRGTCLRLSKDQTVLLVASVAGPTSLGLTDQV